MSGRGIKLVKAKNKKKHTFLQLGWMHHPSCVTHRLSPFQACRQVGAQLFVGRFMLVVEMEVVLVRAGRVTTQFFYYILVKCLEDLMTYFFCVRYMAVVS